MVYNVFTMGVDKMGEFDVALKRMHRVDSIKKQIQHYESLLSQLTIPENDVISDYVSHKETGIVYDLRVLSANLTRLNKEMEEIDEY